MKYQVILDDDCAALETAVNEQIENGWQPLGGVSLQVTHRQYEDRKGCQEDRTDYYYAQAMVKP